MSSVDPRTPVLVGAGQFIQKPDNPVEAIEPLAMMREALEAAADDAGGHTPTLAGSYEMNSGTTARQVFRQMEATRLSPSSTRPRSASKMVKRT